MEIMQIIILIALLIVAFIFFDAIGLFEAAVEKAKSQHTVSKTTNSMKRVCITLFVISLIQVFPGSSFADKEYTKEYNARKIQVIGGSAKMYYHDVGLVFSTSGAVGAQGIPKVINLGDLIMVKDKTVQANIILVTEHLRDMRYDGKLLAKKGQVTCTIAARYKDFPQGKMRDRVWIYVEYCLVLK